MKIRSLIFVGLIFCFSRCSEDSLDQIRNEDVQVQSEECLLEETIKEKELAKSAVIGKWKWIKTRYSSRGTKETIETPLSTNKEKVFEFVGDKLNIYENGILILESNYEIKYWGEGTNTVDEQLNIWFFKPQTAEYGGTSVLFLSTSSTCLKLVNSYDDAGGDLYLKRIE